MRSHVHFTGDSESFWIVEIVAGLLFIAFLSLLLRKIANKRGWEGMKRAIYLPLQVVIWVVGISLISEWIVLHFGLKSVEVYVRGTGQALFIGIIIWLVFRWVHMGFDLLFQRPERLRINLRTVRMLKKLASIVIVILGLLVLFQVFGLNVVPLLTFGGIGMAAFAFAAQDMGANFFGGITLHFARPFDEGDFIELPGQNHFQGHVEEIGWYGTLLRDVDRREVFFPNSIFVKGPVINLSRRTHQRILEKIPLRYRDLDNAVEFIESLRTAIINHPKVDATQGCSIALSGYTVNATELLVDLFTFEKEKEAFLRMKQEILLLVRSQATTHGVEILPMIYVQTSEFSR